LKIGLLSDTHGYFDDSIFDAIRDVDEIWHAGDIGSLHVMDRLKEIAPVRAVFGNIDDHRVRTEWPEYVFIEENGIRFLMIHIAGRLGTYNPRVRELIAEYQPGFLICGHSHILKVQYDNRFNLLYVNPGAVGQHGFHVVRTLITFEISAGKVTEMKAVELGRRGKLS
jgi:putative phosphoesterase